MGALLAVAVFAVVFGTTLLAFRVAPLVGRNRELREAGWL